MNDKFDNLSSSDSISERIETEFKHGQSCVSSGNFVEAIAAFERVLLLDPHYLAVYAELAVLYGQVANIEMEVEILSKWSLLTQDHEEVLIKLAQGFINLGKPAKAELTLRKLISSSPLKSDAYRELAELYLNKKDHHQARNLFHKALQINPQDPNVLSGLGYIYGFLGDSEKAIFYAQKALQIDPELKLAKQIMEDNLEAARKAS